MNLNKKQFLLLNDLQFLDHYHNPKVLNYYYKKHKQNIRAKLRRVKQNKYITNLRAKYSDLNIDEAFQFLALDEKISMQRKGDILSIETFIQISTNRPIPKKRKKFKAQEMVTEL